MNRLWTLVCTLLLTSVVAFGQSAPDFTTLDRKMEEAQTAYSRAERSASSTDKTTLEREFTELQDELAYLRVKNRRGETISDRERREFSTRIDTFVQRANGMTSSSTAAPRTVAVGTELDVRLQTPLNSGSAQVEQRVEATTMVHLYQGDDLLVPAGSLIIGHVAAVDRATRADRKGSLSLSFTRLTVGSRTYDARVQVMQALESEGLRGEATRIGAGSAVGAILGGILGGVRGAVAGILVGGGGVLVATEGKDVDLPSGTVLRVRFDSAVTLD